MLVLLLISSEHKSEVSFVLFPAVVSVVVSQTNLRTPLVHGDVQQGQKTLTAVCSHVSSVL